MTNSARCRLICFSNSRAPVGRYAAITWIHDASSGEMVGWLGIANGTILGSTFKKHKPTELDSVSLRCGEEVKQIEEYLARQFGVKFPRKQTELLESTIFHLRQIVMWDDDCDKAVISDFISV